MKNWFEKGFLDAIYNVARGHEGHKTLFSERIGESPFSNLTTPGQVEYYVAPAKSDSEATRAGVVITINDMMPLSVIYLDDVTSPEDVQAYCFGLSIGLVDRAKNVQRNHRDHLRTMQAKHFHPQPVK